MGKGEELEYLLYLVDIIHRYEFMFISAKTFEESIIKAETLLSSRGVEFLNREGYQDSLYRSKANEEMQKIVV